MESIELTDAFIRQFYGCGGEKSRLQWARNEVEVRKLDFLPRVVGKH